MASRVNRRKLLKGMGWSSLAACLPSVPTVALATQECLVNRKVVVTVFLQGGIHGLSLLVPRNSSPYFEKHPTLAISDSIPLDAAHGLHPMLTNIASLYQSGKVALLNGAGYPGHSQSHNEASSVFDRAVRSQTEQTGWIGRFSREYCHDSNFFALVSIGGGAPPAFTAPLVSGVGISDLDNFGLFSQPPNSTPEDLAFLRESCATLRLSSNPASDEVAVLNGGWASMESSFDLLQSINNENPSQVQYPNTTIGQQLRQAARMITTNLVTVKHLYIAMAGYDTHSSQRLTLQNLMTALDAAIGPFFQDIALANRSQDVVLNIRSEFGRTFENASFGTDHGRGSLEMVMGDPVLGGVHSPAYTEQDFSGSYIPVKLDFREVLEQILIRHLDVDPALVLPESFNRIGLQLFR